MEVRRGTAPIVVGVDGSETGRRALVWAVEEARRRNCPVWAVNVWAYEPTNDILLSGTRYLHEESRALLRREVEVVTRGVTDLPEIVEESMPGSAAHVLVEIAQDATMLVVGRHRGGLIRDAVVGSVSAMCARRAYCPVVVIPEPRPTGNVD